MYADDLSVYLEFKRNRELHYKSNVQCILQAMEKFKEWPGLKMNLGKTYLTIFEKQYKKPKFVDELEIKGCVEFKLLGIYFDATLSKMHLNYDKAIDSIRKELSSWKYRYLTIFGKITVIKTLCLPKLNHIVSVVPNPSLVHLKLLESELKMFISDINPNIVNEMTRLMSKKQMQRIY